MIEPTLSPSDPMPSPCNGGSSGASDVAIDDAGNAYVAGASSRGFLAKLDNAGDSLWITYFSGRSTELPWSRRIRRACTWRAPPPSLTPTLTRSWDKWTTTAGRCGRGVFGGERAEVLTGLAVDSRGGPYVAGETRSADFRFTIETADLPPKRSNPRAHRHSQARNSTEGAPIQRTGRSAQPDRAAPDFHGEAETGR